ncbi:MAG TPA: hypothetical protein V6C63_14285 [Allocoleopsis sp.]
MLRIYPSTPGYIARQPMSCSIGVPSYSSPCIHYLLVLSHHNFDCLGDVWSGLDQFQSSFKINGESLEHPS